MAVRFVVFSLVSFVSIWFLYVSLVSVMSVWFPSCQFGLLYDV